jgi:hypothetical protein
MSTIPSGRVMRMETTEAERAPGVIAVITPFKVIAFAKCFYKIATDLIQNCL